VKLANVRFHNVSNVVSFLQAHFDQEHVGYSLVRRDVNHLFYEVKPKDINRVYHFNAQTIPQTCNLHQVWSVGLNKISLYI
jgi:hypothetical protein